MKSLRRRLTLEHGGRPFLDRWGLVHDRIGGFYLHHIADADPGVDIHDHPWSFWTVTLAGGYDEEYADDVRGTSGGGDVHTRFRAWRRFSIHRMPLTCAHRIVDAWPGTWTLVLRGPTRRCWGFFQPGRRWVDWREYDYSKRRPLTETGRFASSVVGTREYVPTDLAEHLAAQHEGRPFRPSQSAVTPNP